MIFHFFRHRSLTVLDRFFWEKLVELSGEHSEISTEYFTQVPQFEHIPYTANKEAKIHCSASLPAEWGPNPDAPFASLKSNYGWVDWFLQGGQISAMYYESPPAKMKCSECRIEESRFFTELFLTPVEEMRAHTSPRVPPGRSGNCTAYPPLQEKFITLYENAYRVKMPRYCREFFQDCNGGLFQDICIYGIHEWQKICFPDENYWSLGEVTLQDDFAPQYLVMRSDEPEIIYLCDHDGGGERIDDLSRFFPRKEMRQ